MVINPINNPRPSYALADAAATTAATTSPSSSTASSGLGSTAPSEQMFLKLLVAQIQNQDPTSPKTPHSSWRNSPSSANWSKSSPSARMPMP